MFGFKKKYTKKRDVKNIVLYGAGGFAREVASMIENINRMSKTPQYNLLGFIISESDYVSGVVVNGYPVIGTDKWLIAHKDDVVCTCAIGKSAKLRKEIQERLENKGVKFETLIDKSVYVHPTTKIGDGSIICARVMLSVNTTIGKGVVINAATLVGHDVVIGDYTCIMNSCNICGNVTIGTRAYIGGASYIIPGRKIGEDSLVAAGSVVFTNVKEGTKVLGNPAKKIDI